MRQIAPVKARRSVQQDCPQQGDDEQYRQNCGGRQELRRNDRDQDVETEEFRPEQIAAQIHMRLRLAFR